MCMRKPLKASRVHKFESKRNFQITTAGPPFIVGGRPIKPRRQSGSSGARSTRSHRTPKRARARRFGRRKSSARRQPINLPRSKPARGCHVKAVARGRFKLVKRLASMGAAGVRGAVPHAYFVFEIRLRIVWPPCPIIGSVGREKCPFWMHCKGSTKCPHAPNA